MWTHEGQCATNLPDPRLNELISVDEAVSLPNTAFVWMDRPSVEQRRDFAKGLTT